MRTRRTPEAATAAAPPSGGRSSTSGGAAAVPPDWGTKASREATVTYASRIHAHLCEYEDATKKLSSLWGELRVAQERSVRASGSKKPELSAAVRKIKRAIQDLEDRRSTILAGSGPFMEKLLNDDRFRAMTGGALEGSQGPSQAVEEEEEEVCVEEVAPYPPPGGLDNDPKHTSRLCKGYLTKKESDEVLRQMTWPPQSPDLNPIEMVWGELDRRVKAKGPTSAKHLWELLQDCWKTISGDYLLKLIKRMPRVCKAVIKAKGGYFEEPRI
ncbi:uncharacterized protein [Phyllobates terribilis]|uniref:uncharacterized protein n=1 Tax=Phyllobates terribilis TaxID=111132 RepID=UPI003CCAD911